MAQSTRVPVTVSLPVPLAKEFARLARALAKNKSQLFREMFQVYRREHVEAEFRRLQQYGSAQAKSLGLVTEADVEAMLAERV